VTAIGDNPIVNVSTGRCPMRGKLLFSVVLAAGVVVTAASAARLAVIHGTAGSDQLNGTDGSDLIYAKAGNDIVRAHDGSDVVYAGQDNDVVRGGPGNDVVWPGAGADVQYGGPGNDVLHALANDNQPDILGCGAGVDVAYVIAHDPARFRGCEQIIRLSPEEAAALAAANDDS
jgi:Ca2+-binding RTX toxin-like protein